MRLPRDQNGLTLIEMVLTIVILAISLIAISSILSSGTGRSADITLELRSAALAQSYLDEILGKRFDENSHPRGIPPCRSNCTAIGSFGLDGIETRAEFDDVDDYDGLDEGEGQLIPLQDASGLPRTGYDNFRVRVSVRYMDLAAMGTEENLAVAANDLDDSEDAKVITVTVNFLNSGAEGIKYSAYKTNF
jgi:MSHA pilin protein MshD